MNANSEHAATNGQNFQNPITEEHSEYQAASEESQYEYPEYGGDYDNETQEKAPEEHKTGEVTSAQEEFSNAEVFDETEVASQLPTGGMPNVPNEDLDVTSEAPVGETDDFGSGGTGVTTDEEMPSNPEITDQYFIAEEDQGWDDVPNFEELNYFELPSSSGKNGRSDLTLLDSSDFAERFSDQSSSRSLQFDVIEENAKEEVLMDVEVLTDEDIRRMSEKMVDGSDQEKVVDGSGQEKMVDVSSERRRLKRSSLPTKEMHFGLDDASARRPSMKVDVQPLAWQWANHETSVGPDVATQFVLGVLETIQAGNKTEDLAPQLTVEAENRTAPAQPTSEEIASRAADPIARSGSTRLPPPSDFSECGKPESRCNGLWECPDGSDEASCSCRERIDALYVVPNKEPSRVCDGDRDCPFGDDETGCGKCPPNYWSCVGAGQSPCYNRQQWCDGIRNCPNGRDEKYCHLLAPAADTRLKDFNVHPKGVLHRRFPPKTSQADQASDFLPICNQPHVFLEAQRTAVEVCMETVPLYDAGIQPSVTEVALPDRSLAAVKRGQVWVQDVCPTKKGFFVTCDPKESLDSCGLPDTPISQCQCQRRHELWLPSRNKRSFEGRIVGGIATQVLRNPWIASISRKGIPFCGGAIISRWHVVSAGHCFYQWASSAKVYTFETAHYEMTAGSDRVHSEPFSLQRRHATMVKVHPQYEGIRTHQHTFLHDIAMLSVDEPWVFNLWVQPICLPRPSVGSSFPPADMECRVAGWGRQEWQGNVADHLQEVNIKIWSNCRRSIGYVREQEQLCAGVKEGGKDSCSGDSGGPLICADPKDPTVPYLVGVVSHGYLCARAGYPGVYSRITHYMPWIYEVQAEFQSKGLNAFPKDAPLRRCEDEGSRFCPSHPGKCISKKRWCDKISDCMSQEDEKYCKYLSKTPVSLTALQTVSNYVKGPVACAANQWKCHGVEQCIPLQYRCDQQSIPHCPGGSDEHGCRLSEYALRSRSDQSIVCDGVFDMEDNMDEFSCPGTSGSRSIDAIATGTMCLISGASIDVSNWSNKLYDCPNGEDESAVYRLASVEENKIRVNFDSTGFPKAQSSGYMIYNRTPFVKNSWGPLCMAPKSCDVADKICQRLGFKDSRTCRIGNPPGTNANGCAIHLECGQQICGVRSLVHMSGHPSHNPDEAYGLNPWYCEIWADGVRIGGASLISDRYLITHLGLFTDVDLNAKHFSVQCGHVKKSSVHSKHEQWIPVQGIVPLPHANVALIRLKGGIEPGELVAPLCLVKKLPYAKTDDCHLVGWTDEGVRSTKVSFDDVSGVVQLKADRPCMSNWAGAMFCEVHTKLGTQFAAVAVFRVAGGCESTDAAFVPLKSILADLLKAIDDYDPRVSDLVPPPCETHLCPNGRCLASHEICDYHVHCGDASDEAPERCPLPSIMPCTPMDAEQHCVCPPNYIPCGPSSCVSGDRRCNGVSDCPQGTDEEGCVSVQLCDGTVQWAESNVELPPPCECPSGQLKCPTPAGVKPGRSPVCINEEQRCDFREDCPTSEDLQVGTGPSADEAHCIALNATNVPSVDFMGPPSQIPSEGLLWLNVRSRWFPVCYSQVSAKMAKMACEHLGFPRGLERLLERPPFNPPESDVLAFNRGQLLKREDQRLCTLAYIVCAS
ncbi:unnamed protein product [Cyprideis torosa]|uniref:Uncharacterized protein n=1 Tax=Cyprideis torosa TaxID=163714 RepID=A0A7R8ZKX8_9CRUS|nr:unnamed protein product [Cyprideis torosa]CAG0881188.1 unnamed protein product [Cyprideis torosa]